MNAGQFDANLNTLWAHALVDELVRCGVRHAVISPGSRSTPLTLAFAEHPDVVDHSVIDERSAGFYAIGLAQATRAPVVVVCTSGTAAANYFPAVCEAHHSQTPVLVLTADRPAWLRDTGAPQAMRQTALFGDYVSWFHELCVPESQASRFAYLRATMCKAIRLCAGGPVHVNVPLDKPLEPTPVALDAYAGLGTLDVTCVEVTGRPAGAPWVRYAPTRSVPDLDQAREVVWSAARPVVWAGAMGDDPELRDEIKAWRAAGVPIVAEAASGLRGCGEVLAVDHWLNLAENRASFRPDVVLHLGRAPINWPTQRWMASHGAQMVFVGSSRPHLHANADHLPGLHLDGDPCHVLRALRPATRDDAWVRAVESACASSGTQNPNDWGDAAVHQTLCAALPEHAAVFVSSSMPLRDLETQWRDVGRRTLFFNRGLNGIDGVLSTGFGVAAGLSPARPTYIVVGDVAFSHDLGALETAAREGIEATVVVIDNRGGAIFGYLPVKDHAPDAFERHFKTTPTVRLEPLAAAFGMNYWRATDRDGLRAALRAASGLTLIHAVTNDGPVEKRPSGQRSLVGMPGDPIAAAPKPAQVVFLHGFSDTTASWDTLAPEFPHARRFGLPGHNGQTSACSWANALQRLSDFLGDAPTHLVGYSMGGRLALAFAAQHPERVLTLTTVGAHAGWPSDEKETRGQADEALALLAEADLDTFLRRWAQSPILNVWPQTPDVQRAKAARRATNRGAGLADALRNLGPAKMPDIDRSKLTMPCLFVAGSADLRYTAVATELASSTAQGRAEIIQNAGHAAHEDQPEVFAQLLKDHVNRPR